jgi:mono/diheme cytochrome c family protein
MRYFLIIFGLCVLIVMGILGKRGNEDPANHKFFRKPSLYIFPDMEWQLKFRPQKDNDFFKDGRSSQLPVPGTIPRSTPIQTAKGSFYPFEDVPVNTGRQTGTTNYVDNNPMAITAQLMQRGQQRFNINCAPCHGATGQGDGVPKRINAMGVVANLHDKRIVEMADGELFYVITNGRNNMGAYGANVTVPDRWAIVAYLRAVQLARLGSIDDVPEDLRGTLKK